METVNDFLHYFMKTRDFFTRKGDFFIEVIGKSW